MDLVLALATSLAGVAVLYASWRRTRGGKWVTIPAGWMLLGLSMAAWIRFGGGEFGTAYEMMAVSFVWWPWYTRLVYSLVKSIRRDGFVIASEVIGASSARILLGEILPNCAPTILTKMSVDMGLVILFGASLSYLGLGAPAPVPDPSLVPPRV